MAHELILKRKRASEHGGKESIENQHKKIRHSSDSEDGSLGDGSEGPLDDTEVAEEEWGGIDSAAGKEVKRVDRRDSEHVNKPPTRDELRAIKEASELFKSNSFKFQIDALLPHVRPKESRIKPLDDFLLQLHAFLMGLPSKPPSHPLDAFRALLKEGIAVPYPAPLPSDDTAWKVAFEKPINITVVGSWANKTGVKSSRSVAWTIDIALEMPPTIFQEKDYLDCRFFHKKAYYLASLASAIASNKQLHVDAHYESLYSGNRLSSLILTPQKDGSTIDFSGLNACVRLFAVLPSSCPISLHHLSPNHCNLRVKTSEEVVVASSRATPIYNSDLLMCTTSRAHLLRTHELVQELPSFRDALALLRIWANQRGYSPGPKDRGCIVGFEGRGYLWTALLQFLIIGEETFGRETSKKEKRRTLGRGLSSYQLFRAALDLLANHNFADDAIFVKGGSMFPPEAYKQHYGAVFVDSSSVNLLTGVPLVSLDLLRHDAKITLDLLNKSSADSTIDPFAEVFLRDRRQLSTRFDVFLNVDLRKTHLQKSDLVETLDFGGPCQYLLHTLATVIRRALGDRVIAIAVITPTGDPRPPSHASASASLTRINIGLVLNSSNAFRLVDHGPSVSEQQNEEAIEFRDFWGSKAELRRFKDGRISESVVWEVKNSDERARIPSSIVRFILARHLGLDAERDVQEIQKDFDDLLRVPDTLSQRVVPPGVQPGFKSAMAAFDNLVRDLKGLDEDIPLSILNVSPTSSDLRYTSTFTPIPIPFKSASSLSSTMRYLPSMDVVIQFERSGRWPDDLSAIQQMKLAFFERIASALMTKVSGLRATVVTGDGKSFQGGLDRAYLEIVTVDGWAFSVRIWHDREVTHFERLLGKKKSFVTNGTASTANAKALDRSERQSVLEAYQFYDRCFVHAPRHHHAIASLCHRFSAYPGTVRLVKRWFSSHWIHEGHVSGEAIELLCASVFVNDAKDALQCNDETRTDIPATKELGFFRVILLLRDWTWESGLFVSLYDAESSPTEEREGAAHIKAGYGKGVWSISTSEDREGRTWTSEGPDALVARRVKMLASSCMKHVFSHEQDSLNPRVLFLHPSNDYDILIRFKPDILCRAHQSVDVFDSTLKGDKRYANIPSTSSEDDEPLRVDFDPALTYFNDLKRIFAGTLEFFYDPFGGSVIGAVWDPSLLAAKPFRVLADYSSMPTDLEGKGKQKRQVVLNKNSVLAEIQRIGEGLIKSIEIQHVRL